MSAVVRGLFQHQNPTPNQQHSRRSSTNFTHRHESFELDYFRDIIPILAKHFTVYAVDLPGHGQSSIDRRGAYDEPYFRSSMISFIEALDLKDVTLMGESIGGVLSLTLAGSLPDRVKSVIASNPYDYDRYYADGVRRGNLFANVILGSFQIPVLGAINAALENRLFLGWIIRGGVVTNKNMPWDLVAVFDRAGRRRGFRAVERKTFARWRSWSEARALYGRVKVPVTIIYGNRDWSTLEERARNESELPHARIVILENTGHFAVLERSREIAQVILDTQT